MATCSSGRGLRIRLKNTHEGKDMERINDGMDSGAVDSEPVEINTHDCWHMSSLRRIDRLVGSREDWTALDFS